MTTSTKGNILLIEGKRADDPAFFSGLTHKGYHVDTVSNGNSALVYLETHTPHIVLINAVSMRTSGKRICKSIQEKAKDLPVVLVVGQDGENLDNIEANVILTMPFTLQKLLNRIRPLFPAEGKKLIHVGQLKLDVDHRRVRNRNKQVSLTPRLVMLLKALMERPGEVISREELFKTVWETAYIGDTRTLDVHISWLRQALEEDQRHPKFIKTVRGVGYRLDVD
jgi:DNA-binding response OmpR family regulator